MKIFLAGYNIDFDIISSFNVDKKLLTPETISAAYARISRDERPINEIRESAILYVEKTRKSNENIIFSMGHSSIAEHAVFNFDIIDLSRFAIEYLEKFRLASYTEKSQRYVKYENGFIIPKEIIDDKDKQKFIKIINLQNDFYNFLFIELKKFLINNNDFNQKEKYLESIAKEDARYILSLAVYGQLGMTVNARTLEKMIRCFVNSDFLELKELGNNLYNFVKPIAPSLIKYVDFNIDYKTNFIKLLKSCSLTEENEKDNNKVRLIKYDLNVDDEILSIIIYNNSDYNISFHGIKKFIKTLSNNDKMNIMKKFFLGLKSYDDLPREFEFIDFIFEAVVSAACFGQLKRHRMMSLLNKNYDINLGITIPENIKRINFEKEFTDIINETNELYYYLKSKYGKVANYILTNSHMRKVLFKINIKNLYHFIRLRSDNHAQWDIKNLSNRMLELTKKIAPISMLFACGKDNFDENYRKIFKKKI